MKKVNLQFDLEESAEDIDVTITASEKDAQVVSLIKSINEHVSDIIIVHDGNGVFKPLSELSIISISTDGRKLKVVSEEGPFELDMTLQDVYEKLDRDHFIKISRFEIINLDKVKCFSFPVSGTLEIEMMNGMKTWASRRSISTIKDRLMKGGDGHAE